LNSVVPCLAIDIGSTWTKGALFGWQGSELVLQCRNAHPTTVHDLGEGFAAVLRALLPGLAPAELQRRVARGELAIDYSSSAKGGLAVAALGLVPEITLEVAKLAACSAGAKLTQVLSYRLNGADIRALEQNPPDILLFAGGTDGGNTDYLLRNAQALARSSLRCAMVYAGNRAVRDEVCALLADRDIIAVDNLLPALDTPNPEPAREALRQLFLQRIVRGKGLDRVVDLAGVAPAPTPYAMLEFARTIADTVPGWEEFLLLDIGGATTDVYSSHREAAASGVVVRGLPEPGLKRTVEGDLGLRVSAAATLATGRAVLAGQLGIDIADMERHVQEVTVAPQHLPGDDGSGQRLDALLAGYCLAEACARHAGRSHEVSTPDGLVQLQTGRDLRGVRRVIGSGGWLAQAGGFDPAPWLRLRPLDERGRSVLLPQRVDYFRDTGYLFPLLANVARRHPAAAARAGVRALESATGRSESFTSSATHGIEQPPPDPRGLRGRAGHRDDHMAHRV
jgi:uncharacterized protein (TIGR01319 family)